MSVGKLPTFCHHVFVFETLFGIALRRASCPDHHHAHGDDGGDDSHDDMAAMIAVSMVIVVSVAVMMLMGTKWRRWYGRYHHRDLAPPLPKKGAGSALAERGWAHCLSGQGLFESHTSYFVRPG
jgi:hypothetical protein